MVTPLSVLDLFSGIGGFSLGLEWTGGYQTVGFCEACPKARKILAKRWPGVPIFEDVRTLTKETIDDECGTIDVVCGGFPCQDISLAGKGEGLAGSRSGLWFEMLRIIDATRPRFVIAENVSALRSRGLDRVLGSLTAIGYDAEWHCVPASAVGAPHRRDRIWIIAFPNSDRDGEPTLSVDGGEVAVLSEPMADSGLFGSPAQHQRDAGGVATTGGREGAAGSQPALSAADRGADVADSEGDSRRSGLREVGPIIDRDLARDRGADVSDADGDRPSERRERPAPAGEGDGRRADRAGGRADAREERLGSAGQGAGDVPDADRSGRIEQRRPEPVLSQLAAAECGGWWSVEPDVGRVAHGVPGRVDRLKQLGNAVVPHIPFLIGRELLKRC